MSRYALSHRFAGRKLPKGFTLIEILIVVVILGILAAIVIPQFSSASNQARESTLKDCLRYLREQIGIYKMQHNDVPPGYPAGNLSATPDAPTFLSQMTGNTDIAGNVGASYSDVFHNGPYLSQMPNDPLNNLPGIWVVTGGGMPAPDASQPFGWIYNPSTQEIIANLPGNDLNGVPYSTY